MSCIPKGTKKISGKWDTSSGAKERDDNWKLIEKYIQEDAFILGRGPRGYLVTESDAERGWRLTYGENDDGQQGPPTLELFLDFKEYLSAREKQFSDSLATWQRRYMNHLASSHKDKPWPGVRNNLFKITTGSSDFRKYWGSVRLNFKSQFQQFMDEATRHGDAKDE